MDTEVIASLTEGFYDVTVTNDDGCEATTSVQITAPNAPLTVAIEEAAGISCFGAADGVLEALVSGPFTSLTFNWSDGQIGSLAQNLDVGDYNLQVVNQNGCEAMASYMLDQPDAILAEVFKSDITCVGGSNSGVITIENVRGGRPGYSFSADGDNFGASPLFEGLEAGAYNVIVRDAAGCELSLPTSILPPPEITVDLGPDQEIKLGDLISLEAITNSMAPTFTWSHADTLTTGTAVVQPKESSLYQVMVLDTVTLCDASSFVRIFVNTDRRVFIPNAFSPNGDGQNDVFFPFGGDDVVSVKVMRIFSRSGQLVYEALDFPANNPEVGWNGEFQGRLLNPAVFVYYAEIEFLDGRTEVMKGDVLLLR